MTLQQLRYFVTACKYQSLTKAAGELSVSQPGISTAIRDLERECGFLLFEHRPNSILLTDQGQSFRREAERLLQAYERLQENTQIIARENTVLRMGVAPMGAGMAFPRLRRGFHMVHPEVAFEMTEDFTEVLYRQIDAGELDFALTVSIAPPGDEYQYVELRQSRLLFCIHRERLLAGEDIHSLTQLGQTPLIMLSDDNSQTKYLKRLFREVNYTPNIIQYTSQVFTILQHIRENAAAGFLSEEITEQEDMLVRFALREVESASVTVIWKKNARIFPAMEAFIQYIRGVKESWIK